MTFREVTFCKNDMLIFLGTKADLWNTVSPKMAQRVFSEMLNESLSIITTRFIHVSSRDISRLVAIYLPICFVSFISIEYFIVIVNHQREFYIRSIVKSIYVHFCSFT